MPASAGTTRTLLLDTNVFVAAVKHPRRETASLRLILGLLRRDEVRLVGNVYWIEELLRYAEEFHSETAAWLISALLDRTRIVEVTANFVRISARYVRTPDLADVVHAATCLQERAILVSNDRHFDRIQKAKIIDVWGITKALQVLGLLADSRNGS